MADWKYYNHALISVLAPHMAPDVTSLADKTTWASQGGHPLFARWTTDFDCAQETPWWYVIKDAPFDLSSLKAKRRYEINKGIKNFDFQQIDPRAYKDALYEVQVAAFSAYPAKYRPTVNYEEFIKDIDNWSSFMTFGAFTKDEHQLAGYALLEKQDDRCMKFSVQKTIPNHEKSGVNAALVFGILEHYAEFLRNGGYICDGERSVNHETQFQNYLEKYFEFRKAYCRLHIEYCPGIRRIIKLVYPFRKLLLRFDDIGLVHSINAVLRMEEIVRSC